jgi:hypothetical protein
MVVDRRSLLDNKFTAKCGTELRGVHLMDLKEGSVISP